MTVDVVRFQLHPIWEGAEMGRIRVPVPATEKSKILKAMSLTAVLAGLFGVAGGLLWARVSASGNRRGVIAGLPAPSPKMATLTGEIVDMDCFMADGSAGEDHQFCAAMCLANGASLGLLTEDGKAYFLVGTEDGTVRGWGGKRARIRGAILGRDGTRCLRVDNAERL